ncbi:hypothetical protein BH20ACT6_BH20ACT6_01660 [soil metagenome]
MRCPDGAVLAAWVDAELDEPAADAVAGHLEDCTDCVGIVRAHHQVKRVTTGLCTLPEPAPRDALMHSLLQLPTAEQRRLRTVRCSSGTAANSRIAGAAVGVGVGAGLVAAAWLGPIGTASQPAPGGAPPPTAGSAVTPAGLPSTPPGPVTPARWSADD